MDSDKPAEKPEPFKGWRKWLYHAREFVTTREGLTFVVTIIMLVAVFILFAQARSASRDNREILKQFGDCLNGTGPCGEANAAAAEEFQRFIIASNYCAVKVTSLDVDDFTTCIIETAPKVELPK